MILFEVRLKFKLVKRDLLFVSSSGNQLTDDAMCLLTFHTWRELRLMYLPATFVAFSLKMWAEESSAHGHEL